jgi:DNA-binding IclR family transcriptional regulator
MQDDPSTTAQRRQGIQSIARAAQVLRAVAAAPAGIGLVELAGSVALPKSTVHRIVGALSAEGLLAGGGDGPIRLGAGLGELAAAAPSPLPERLRPLLEELSEQLGETVDLAVRGGARVRFLDQVQGGGRLQAISAVGEEFPLHCTANGKALLAELPPEAVEALLPARLPRLTPATITSRRALLAELEQVRARGVAYDREEHTEGICAVGAVVRDGRGGVAALSVPVPASRFGRVEARCASAVAEMAERASRLLDSGG